MSTARVTAGPAALLAAAVIWGTVGPAQVLSGTTADPGALGAARLLVGGLVLGLPLARGIAWRRMTAHPVLLWVLVTAVATALYQATFLYAIDRAGAALGTTVALGCAPFATGAFAWWWLGQPPDRRWLGGTAAAVVGCALVLAPAAGVRVDPLGVLLAVASGCCYGAYNVSAKIFLDAGLPQLSTVAVTLVLAGVLLTPFLLLRPGGLTEPATLWLLGWLSLVATAMAYGLFALGLARSSASTAGTLSLAGPLAAAVLGVVVLHERLSTAALVGCLVLLAGLAVVAVPVRAPRP